MDIFLARQPIFDTEHRVVGYEIVYRGSGRRPEKREAAPSPEALGDGRLEAKVRELAGGKAAFVNFSRESLLARVPETLGPKAVIIQIQGTMAPDDKVVSVCQELAGRGFRFALGDFVLHERHNRLLRMAEVVKVNVQTTEAEDKVALADKLGAFKGKLLAEGVENRTVHEYCRALGFKLFQGFHYFRPESLTNTDLPTQSISVVRILNLLRDPRSSDAAIQEAFRSDPSLSFQLLQLVNSAALGGRGINSIGHAMRMLGREPLHRWLSMLLLSKGKDAREVRTEIVKSSLMRGRMCEILGEDCRKAGARDLPPGGTLFLIGLFSQLDTLLQMPMDLILSRIDLAGDVVEALLQRGGRAGGLLTVVEDYEQAEWDLAEDRLRDLGGEADSLSEAYLDSVTWASDRVLAGGD
jgi:c-di-GMP phosphodiesterase